MSSHDPTRTLLVEDEVHARRYLRELLSAEDEIVIVGEAATGREGVELVRALAPQLVLLDVQMPDLDGFGLVTEIGPASMPAFIFVTAYQDYAVRAFEIEAVDYVCKPFDRERLSAAIQRGLRFLRMREAWIDGEPGLDADLNPAGPWLTRVIVKDGESITFVRVEDILWLEAANKYVVIHTADGTHVVRQTIQSLASQLDPSAFVRTHRALVVRKSAIRGLQPLFHGDYIVRLTNGTELPLSRTFREAFFAAMSR
jgi:two-component system LytT family response regulator